MQSTLLNQKQSPIVSIEAIILQICSAGNAGKDRLDDALRYHFQSGGKHVRSAITLHCAKALGIETETAIRLGASVECLHNASLIQDDLQDRSFLRRGHSPVWKEFCPDTAICLTDLLISSAYALIAQTTSNRVASLIGALHEAVGKTLRGQMLDTGAEDLISLPNDSATCLEVSVAKSGPFFALALILPLIEADLVNFTGLAMDAALHFGRGYQAFDDLEDLEQDEREGNTHNLVLAFKREGHTNEASVKLTIARAHHHLEQSSELAKQLPYGCGTLLSSEAKKIESRLQLLA